LKDRHQFAFLLALALLTGCAQYAIVSETKPRFRPIRATVGALASVERSIAEGLKSEHRNPLAALGEYVGAADRAAQQLAKDPNDTAARTDYNFAVARVITTIRDAKLDPWTQPLHLSTANGGYVLDYRRDKRKEWNPALYRLTPAD
jgi:hypothetical protein